MNQTNSSTTPHERIAHLYDHARNFRLTEYRQLSEQLTETLRGADLGEVYLLRAQLKLFTCDETLLDDLTAADELLQGASRIPPFFDTFEPLSPNTFFMFPPTEGGVARFQKALRDAHDLLDKYCGARGVEMSEQVESEILYFTGRIVEAIALSEPMFERFAQEKNYAMAIPAGYTLLRCCMATGRDTYPVISAIFKWSRDYPESCCPSMYKVIRSWANVTTGWSGDTPRYHTMPTGGILPALEDRIDAIEHGIAELTTTEIPFAEMRRADGAAFCTMRELYVDVFKMMVDFKFHALKGAEHAFRAFYTTSRNTGLIMPIVEYGHQIVPLLESVLEADAGKEYDAQWIENLIDLSSRYEKRLRRFRAE